MVKMEKTYQFHGPDASTPLSLEDLFVGKDQLIVCHFMFAPEDGRGFSGCPFVGEHIPDVRHLRSRNVALAVVPQVETRGLGSIYC